MYTIAFSRNNAKDRNFLEKNNIRYNIKIEKDGMFIYITNADALNIINGKVDNNI